MTLKVSQEFHDAFTDGSGSCVRQCDRCGVTCFDAFNMDSWDWNEGEFESLQAEEEKDPKKFKGVDHSVGGYIVLGIHVLDCCDCPAQLEKIVWAHRKAIVKYITERSKRELSDRQSILDSLNG
jgi:hypothetical protein